MQVQCDSREKKSELKRIQNQFDHLGVHYFVSKLYVGDYMSLDNPRKVIDRKKDLGELCSNVTQQHERFRAELVRAKENGIQVIILCEHGGNIRQLEDVFFWENPRRRHSPKATSGAQLFRSLCTMRDRYGVQFAFCDKRQTGKEIVRLLS